MTRCFVTLVGVSIYPDAAIRDEWDKLKKAVRNRGQTKEAQELRLPDEGAFRNIDGAIQKAELDKKSWSEQIKDCGSTAGHRFVRNISTPYTTTINGMGDALAALWQLGDDVGIAAQRLKVSGGELSSLSMQEPENGDIVYLLHSDTLKGEFCAEIIASAIRKGALGGGITVKPIVRINDLQEFDMQRFAYHGSINLVKKIADIFLAHQDCQCILNVTGGYKGTIPYASTTAMLLDMPVIYLYEKSDQSLDLAPIPLTIQNRTLYERCKKAFEILSTIATSEQPEYPSDEYFWREWIPSEYKTGIRRKKIDAYFPLVRDKRTISPAGILYKTLCEIFEGLPPDFGGGYDV